MKVIIVGAGIAGLSAAIGLRRKGHDVTIFERSSLLRELGAAITICPNAARVLLDWQVDTARARMVVARRRVLASARSLEIHHSVPYPDFAELYGGPWLLAHRVDLHCELRRLACDPTTQGKPAEIITKAEVVDYDTENGSITLADGCKHHADLLVAADGVHTTAINHVIGHQTPATATGWAVFRFLLTTEDLVADPELCDILSEGPTKLGDGIMKLFVVPENMTRLAWYPCSDNKIQNMVIIHEDTRKNVSEREDWDRSVDVEDVLFHTRDFHPHLQKIFRKATAVKRWPLLYREPIPTLRKGRLVLIGDAVHPMLPHQGQGGAMGIEDGAALGEVFACLADNPPEEEILNRIKLFEKVRLRRVSAIQVLSNAGQDQVDKVRERAQEYMPDGVKVPSTASEFWDHNFGYDAIGDSRRQLQAYLEDSSGNQGV